MVIAGAGKDGSRGWVARWPRGPAGVPHAVT